MNVIVVGSGKTLYFLARTFLAKGHTVTLVCRDAAECRQLARQLRATVLAGDGSDPAVLEEARAHEADAVVAATGRDPDNLVICQIAEKRFGVPTTLAVVNDPDHLEVFPKLGVKNVVAVAQLVSSVIEERAATGEIANLTVLGQGALNVTELVLPDSSPALGKPLAQAALPRDVLVAGVVRGGEAIIPHGDMVLAAGDRVVVVTLPWSHGRAIRFLTGEA